MEQEGQAINKPPLFDETDDHYRKKRMMAFLDEKNVDIWELIENGYSESKDSARESIPKSKWTIQQKSQYQLNLKAKHYLMCAITRSEHDKIHSCDNAKDIQDTLALAHEGSSYVKESKINMLIHQYELFKMLEYETIDQIFERFQTMSNSLRSLGKTYDNKDHFRKILMSLSKEWRPKVTYHEVHVARIVVLDSEPESPLPHQKLEHVFAEEALC